MTTEPTKVRERYLFNASVKAAGGYQTFRVDAYSEEEALAKLNNGAGEIYAVEVDVTDLEPFEFDSVTALADFGDYPPISTLDIRDARIAELEGVLSQRTRERDLWYGKVQDLEAVKKKLEAQLAELRGQEPIGYVTKNAVIRMHEGRMRFCSLFPEASGRSIIAVYLDPVPPAASQPYTVPDEITFEQACLEVSGLSPAEAFMKAWNNRAAMLQSGNYPVSPNGWEKGRFAYDTLFNAIGKAVNIQGGALSISVKSFEDAMLAAAPQHLNDQHERINDY